MNATELRNAPVLFFNVSLEKKKRYAKIMNELFEHEEMKWEAVPDSYGSRLAIKSTLEGGLENFIGLNKVYLDAYSETVKIIGLAGPIVRLVDSEKNFENQRLHLLEAGYKSQFAPTGKKLGFGKSVKYTKDIVNALREIEKTLYSPIELAVEHNVN